MSLVTATEQARVLALLGSGSARRDELLLSLSRKMIWTTAQRELVNRIWDEERAKRKEQNMRKTLVVGVAMVVGLFALSGCTATFTKTVIDEKDTEIVGSETREINPLINWIAPEWMNLRRELVQVNGRVVSDRTCTENYDTLTQLLCVERVR